MSESDSRYERGMRKFLELNGDASAETISSLEAISPDFVNYLVEFPFGDVYSRPLLDSKTREIVAIAALAALGNTTNQLKAHIEAAATVGWSRDEILEVMIQIAVLAGFPAAINGILAVKEAFSKRELNAASVNEE